MLKRSVQFLKRSGWALALCLLLVAGLLGTSERSLAGSSSESPIQVYTQSDVNCDAPQYAPIDPDDLPMSFYEYEEGWPSITLFVCSKGTDAHVQLYAEAAGKGAAVDAHLVCKPGTACGDFEDIEPKREGFTGQCGHPYIDYEDDVYLPEGKYRMFTFAGHVNAYPCFLGYHTGLLDIYALDGDITPPSIQ